jgi:hypothetical protein
MKKIAILVIAATNQPVYIHYIKTYWTALIRHLGETRRHIDVFLLFENNTDLQPFEDLRQHIIQDPRSDFSSLCDPKHQNLIIPGILSKTIHAFELLQDQYDVFFRTNLSSIIRIPYFDQLVQDKAEIRYSGGFVWTNSLRESLEKNGRIGPNRNIKNLSELKLFPGNTFISGSGYLISSAEVKDLVKRKHEFRYDIVDDVSVGLMLAEHEFLPGFSLQVSPSASLAEIKCQIRESNSPHIRLTRFPLEKASSLWEDIQHGQLWQVRAPQNIGKSRYKVCFPLFDHKAARSNEMRMTHEGLRKHSSVSLVDDPNDSDYLVLCQNHIVDHCPFHDRFRPLKDQHKSKTILMDFDDDSNLILDRNDFRWALYFKRSCVDRNANCLANYKGLPVIATAYGVVDDMVEPPAGYDGKREIAISCLFHDYVCETDSFAQGRGKLLRFAKSFRNKYNHPMQIGPVSAFGSEGRRAINEKYKQCLYNSKIVLHANPDRWEGDARTWEAICSGALVFVDRMHQPIPHPLVDGKHVIFYDLSAEGLEQLERKIIFYLENDEERARIGQQGRDFVLRYHRSVNRINEMIWHLDAQAADRAELKYLLNQEKEVQSRKLAEKSRPAWQTPGFLDPR